MVIYEHFFWNYAVFFRRPWAWKVGLGGIGPDALYLAAFAPRLLSYGSFVEWMHDPLWDTLWNSSVAKSAHSVIVWGAACLGLLALVKRDYCKGIFPFLLGWGLHILFDMFTHVSDGYAPFFPLSSYRFPAPVSYWESEFFGTEYFWISHSLMAGLFLLWVVSRAKGLSKKTSEPVQPSPSPGGSGRGTAREKEELRGDIYEDNH